MKIEGWAMSSPVVYKVVNSVCPIITHKPLNLFASNIDLGSRGEPREFF